MQTIKTTVKERLIEFIEAERISIREFERRCKLSNGYVKGVKYSILPDKMRDITLQFPHLNTTWLMTGDGEMINNSSQGSCVSVSSKEAKITTLNNLMADIQQGSRRRDRMLFIPLLNVDAVGGANNDVCDMPEYIEDMIPVTGAREGSICISVSGDSMMPVFTPGDLVVIDEVLDWALFLEMGQYYVIALKDNRRLIKKITYSETDREHNFLLVSENFNYPSMELPKNLIHRMFIVTQKHQRLTL